MYEATLFLSYCHFIFVKTCQKTTIKSIGALVFYKQPMPTDND